MTATKTPPACDGEDLLSVSFEDAAENHLRDALRMTHAMRWRWLAEAMDFGFEIAKARARRGLPTKGPHGEIIVADEIAPPSAANEKSL